MKVLNQFASSDKPKGIYKGISFDDLVDNLNGTFADVWEKYKGVNLRVDDISNQQLTAQSPISLNQNKICLNYYDQHFEVVSGELRSKLGTGSVPGSFASLTVTSLTPNRLVASNAGHQLVSVANLTTWIAGTINRVTVTDDGDGTITLSTPQDTHAGASPTFVGITLTGLTVGYLPRVSALNALENSLVYDTGTQIGINTAAPLAASTLHVNGHIAVNNRIYSNDGLSWIQLGNTGTGHWRANAANIVEWDLSGPGAQLLWNPANVDIDTYVGSVGGIAIFVQGSDGFIGFNTVIPSASRFTFVGTMAIDSQITSTLAFGTSPFAVTSSTVNTNLNADLLDGYHAAAFAPANHNLLSTTHGDSSAAAVVDGDIIIGNVTPAWSKLAISIPAANVRNALGIDNGELRPSWKATLDGILPETLVAGGAGQAGTSLIYSHRDHNHPAPATWPASSHALDDTTYHTIGSLTSTYFPYILTNKLVNSVITQSSNYIGIGQAVPGYRLHVVSADGVSDNTYVSYFDNQEATASRNNGIWLKAGSNANDYNIRGVSVAAAELWCVTGAGNFGIGASSPASLLEIYSSTASPILTITGAHATSYDPQIQFRTATVPTVKWSMGVDATDDSFFLNYGTGFGTLINVTTAGVLSITTNNEKINLYESDVAIADGYIQFTNNTVALNTFIPSFKFKGNTNISLDYVNGIIADSAFDTAGHVGAIFNISSRYLNNLVTNRPLLTVTNYNIQVLAVTASGITRHPLDNYGSTYGAGNDFHIYHDGTSHVFEILTGSGSFIFDGMTSVDISTTVVIAGGEAQNARLEIRCDEGDDAADRWRLQATYNATSANNTLVISNDTAVSGTYLSKFVMTTGGNFKVVNDSAYILFGAGDDVGIKYDGTNTIFETIVGTATYIFDGYTTVNTNCTLKIGAGEAKDAILDFLCDEADDAADTFRIRTVYNATSANTTLDFQNDTAVLGTFITRLRLSTGGNLTWLGDSQYAYFGAGVDMGMAYDGTYGIINTSLVAASDLRLTCGANKTLELQNVVYDDIRINLGNISRPGGSDPSWVSYTPSGAGTATYLLQFAKNNYGTFTVQLPHGYNGGDIKVHLHWTPGPRGAAESGNTVGWKILYSWADIGGNFGAMATADLSDACDGTNHKHQMTPEITIAGPHGISSMILCNVIRTDTGADDTWVGTASGELPMLTEADFHYPINTIGSRDWGTK